MGLVYDENLAVEYAVWGAGTAEAVAGVHENEDDSGATAVIPATVFAYRWNDAVVIARQHPPYPSQINGADRNPTRRNLIGAAQGKLHKPTREIQYRELRNDVNAPSGLSLPQTTRGSP